MKNLLITLCILMTITSCVEKDLESLKNNDEGVSDQEIIFGAIPVKKVEAGKFVLEATSTSGLPVTYTSSDPDIASIDGDSVFLHQVGTVSVTAFQEGNESYNPAQEVERELKIEYAELLLKRYTQGRDVFIFEYDEYNRLILLKEMLTFQSDTSTNGIYGWEYDESGELLKETLARYDVSNVKSVCAFTYSGNEVTMVTSARDSVRFTETVTLEENGYTHFPDQLFDERNNITQRRIEGIRSNLDIVHTIWKCTYDDKKSPFYACQTPKWWLDIFFYYPYLYLFNASPN
ncbi:MAG: hypothetical protein LBQ60_15625, partial [Bacteroidales bacterium]|nr:hypothetical protein [Bacteroidales bacterium]